MFKLKLVKTYHLSFVVHVLQKCCWHSISQKLSKQTNWPKGPNQTFNCDFLNCVFKWHILRLHTFQIVSLLILESLAEFVGFMWYIFSKR